MNYRIVYDKPAVKFLKRQSKDTQQRIVSAIHKLPDAGDIKPLSGYVNLFRLRVGGFRVIYPIENDMLIIRVLEIGNRGNIYK